MNAAWPAPSHSRVFSLTLSLSDCLTQRPARTRLVIRPIADLLELPNLLLQETLVRRVVAKRGRPKHQIAEGDSEGAIFV